MPYRDGRAPRPEIARFTDTVTYDQVASAVQYMAIGMAFAQDEAPLLGSSIYDSVYNPDFPRVLGPDEFFQGEVVFAQALEGEELPHASVAKKTSDVLVIGRTGAVAEITKDALIFGETWRLGSWAEAMGRADRRLQNHIRFYPILNGSYSGQTTGTVYKKVDGSNGTSQDYDYTRTVYETLKKALVATAVAKRPASVIVCSLADSFIIREIVSGVRTPAGLTSPLPGVKAIEVYDGVSVTVNNETTTYEGVTAGTIYLVRPFGGFKEREKQKLMLSMGEPDLSRGIAQQIVGDSYRGHLVDVANNVQKVTIPTL